MITTKNAGKSWGGTTLIAARNADLNPTRFTGYLAWLLWIASGSDALSILAGELGSEQPAWGIVAEDEAALWKAAREGDLPGVQAAIAAGVDVNAATIYGATALSFAADRGHLEIVQWLLARGGDPNVKDTFYGATPMTWARSGEHFTVITALLAGGAEGADQLLLQAIAANQFPLAEAIVASGKVSPTSLAVAKLQADARYEAPWKVLFREVSLEGVFNSLSPEQQTALLGEFELDTGNYKLTFSLSDEQLVAAFGNAQPTAVYVLEPTDLLSGIYRLQVTWESDQVQSITTTMGGNPVKFVRPGNRPEVTQETPAEPAQPMPQAEKKATDAARPFQPHPEDATVSSVNWPSFRGIGARGVADGQQPPVTWDATTNKNVLWRTSIAGLGNSCPVIWEDRLLITTARSEQANLDVRIGLYGDVDSVVDDSEYDFQVLCLHKRTGHILWERTVKTARPAVKRHSKSSHANPTIATDGRHVIAFFGSEGLYCLDMEGQVLWSVDLGFLDSGWFFDPGYQWGFGSSPIIFQDRVFVQCDIQENSFVAAFDIATGQEVWRTNRDEIPTWPTPTVHTFGDIPMLLTHGTRAARGYDARDGQLLWELPGHSEIVVPTPFVARGLIYLASGYSPIQPIIALRPNARGQVELKAVEPAADGEREVDPTQPIAWSTLRGGPYMPTPLAYGDHLYICANNGLVTCFELTTGVQVYRERLRIGGTAAFTASPIAADGHLYFTAEDGRIAVVKAGEEFELVSVNPLGKTVMATPAISAGVLYVRSINELVALQDQP
jgi:outer membrane protein assembly factor BamB